jgi:hypothetical protein
VPQSKAFDSCTLRQDWVYFQVPSSEPPQAPPYAQIASFGSCRIAKRVKCEMRPVTRSAVAVEATGNHCPLA